MPAAEHAAIAARAIYAGSPEHKVPHKRIDATACPADLGVGQEDLTAWIRKAIRAGAAGGLVEGGFPRYVWYRDGDRCFEGRLTNQGRGEYKGYPVEPEEVPEELPLDG
jgi:hypothetical protein